MKLLKKILLYWIVIIPFSIVSISLTLIPVMTGGFISGSFSELLVGVIAFPFIVLIFFLPVMHTISPNAQASQELRIVICTFF